jgi:predicted flap endonuclease-1-like 5' DNA nuclease
VERVGKASNAVGGSVGADEERAPGILGHARPGLGRDATGWQHQAGYYESQRRNRVAKLTKVEGIGEVYARKLQEAGIATTDALLKQGATPKGREEIAEKAGISGKLILEWVNHTDLFRIKGVGEEYADLLEAAGVDTVPELAQRNPKNLYQKLAEVNEEKKLVRQIPAQTQVESWVEQAKGLPRVITY